MISIDIIEIIIIILFFHLLGDFVFSNHRDYRDSRVDLFKHAVVYSFCLYGGVVLISIFYGFSLIIWAFINVALHFIVDLVTSQIRRCKHFKNNVSIITGFDQIIHISILLFTLKYYVY